MDKENQNNIFFVASEDEYHCDIALQLQSLGKNIRAFMTYHPEVIKDLIIKFQKTKIFDAHYLNTAFHIRQLDVSIREFPGDVNLLKYLNKEQHTVLRISDRMAVFPLSVGERIRLYHALVAYWFREIKNNDIRSICFTSTPHLLAEYTLYVVANYLGLKLFIFGRTLHPMTTWIRKEIVPSVKTSNDQSVNKKLETRPSQFLKKLLIQECGSFWLNLSQEHNSVALKPDYLSARIIKLFARIRTLLKQNELSVVIRKISTRIVRYFKVRILYNKNSPSHFLLNDKPSRFKHKIEKIRQRKKVGELRRHYQKLSTNFSCPTKFVLLALHYQPERTTLPEGGIFDNQLFVAKILSESLPKDFSLIVKEHPRQFDRNDLRQKFFRDKKFYDDLLALNDTILCPVQILTQDLMEKAAAVATVSGSIGWEALVGGIPVFCFGAAWYMQFPGCFVVRSRQDLQHAFSSIFSLNRWSLRKSLANHLETRSSEFIDSPLYSISLGQLDESARSNYARAFAVNLLRYL